MATAAPEVTVPGSGGRSLRARLRALPVMGGLLPVRRSQVAVDVLAGITLAAVSIPVSLGYAKIAGMPVVTGLYTLLLPMAVFAVLGSSRHLVVGADSATAAILGAALAGLAVAGSPQYVRLAGLVALLAGWRAAAAGPGWPGSGSWRISCPAPS
jgi:SulP family sulfate permease